MGKGYLKQFDRSLIFFLKNVRVEGGGGGAGMRSTNDNERSKFNQPIQGVGEL